MITRKPVGSETSAFKRMLRVSQIFSKTFRPAANVDRVALWKSIVLIMSQEIGSRKEIDYSRLINSKEMREIQGWKASGYGDSREIVTNTDILLSDGTKILNYKQEPWVVESNQSGKTQKRISVRVTDLSISDLFCEKIYQFLSTSRQEKLLGEILDRAIYGTNGILLFQAILLFQKIVYFPLWNLFAQEAAESLCRSEFSSQGDRIFLEKYPFSDLYLATKARSKYIANSFFLWNIVLNVLHYEDYHNKPLSDTDLLKIYKAAVDDPDLKLFSLARKEILSLKVLVEEGDIFIISPQIKEAMAHFRSNIEEAEKDFETYIIQATESFDR